MIKKWLSSAVDRSFRLIAAVMMRRAIARLVKVDEGDLSQAGLSRAAVTDFLESPLRTDPHRFFTRRLARNEVRRTAEYPGVEVPGAIEPIGIQHHADGSVAFHVDRVRAATPRRPAILRVIHQITGLRFRLLAAGVAVCLCAVGACSNNAVQHGAATIRRDQPARCHLRPDALPWTRRSRPPDDHAAPWRSARANEQRLGRQPDARDGPAGTAS